LTAPARQNQFLPLVAKLCSYPSFRPVARAPCLACFLTPAYYLDAVERRHASNSGFSPRFFLPKPPSRCY